MNRQYEPEKLADQEFLNKWKILDEPKFLFGWHQLVMPACPDVSIDRDDYRSSGHHQSRKESPVQLLHAGQIWEDGYGRRMEVRISLSIPLSLFLSVEILAISIQPHSPLHVLSHIHSKVEPLICSQWRASFATLSLWLF